MLTPRAKPRVVARGRGNLSPRQRSPSGKVQGLFDHLRDALSQGSMQLLVLIFVELVDGHELDLGALRQIGEAS